MHQHLPKGPLLLPEAHEPYIPLRTACPESAPHDVHRARSRPTRTLRTRARSFGLRSLGQVATCAQGAIEHFEERGRGGHGIDLGVFLDDGNALTFGRDDGADERVFLAMLNPVPLPLAIYVGVEDGIGRQGTELGALNAARDDDARVRDPMMERPMHSLVTRARAILMIGRPPFAPDGARCSTGSRSVGGHGTRGSSQRRSQAPSRSTS